MAEAAIDAADMWAEARPADATHSYLAKKGMPGTSLRQHGQKLLVPMVDATGQLRNLQRIGADGSKRFLRGGGTVGLFFLSGRFTAIGETACIGEGLATMRAVFEASGFPSIVTFSAKNILPWRASGALPAPISIS